MKNLWGVLKGLLIVVIFQLTLVSCTEDNSEIIKSQDDKTQLEQDYQKTDPINGGGRDDDDEEGGS
ncbi:MAG: hypothetical protein L3J20_01820 [Flavobacteriaceae bacterium]|nr:hypothetical protein [Flavobacteriaceae bacterium]